MLILLFFLQINNASAFNVDNNACYNLDDYPIRTLSLNCYVNPTVMAPTPAIIKQNGFKVLSYNVTTGDGYILQLFRIPPLADDNRTNRTPVFLDHGLFADSSVWTLIGNRSLAFSLASQGYDVWLANQRGTIYSRTNTEFNDSEENYWNFNLDTIASKDIPNFLYTIANVTGRAGSIVYLGHSRGTTLIFMYASENPEEAQMLLGGIVALCPIVYFDMVWYLRLLVDAAPTLGNSLLTRRLPVLFYNLTETYDYLFQFCSAYPRICRSLIDVTSGITWQFPPDDLLVFFTHGPSSESVLLLLQYAQMASSGRFQKFDYGLLGNMERYGQEQPPLYNLENIKLPVYMFYGENDILIKNENVDRIFDELGSMRKMFWKIPVDINEWRYKFGHNDFIWGEYLDTFLYPYIFNVLEEMRD